MQIIRLEEKRVIDPVQPREGSGCREPRRAEPLPFRGCETDDRGARGNNAEERD